jgi:Zn-dependent M28 family amino/carboxypeptidase
VLATKIGPRNVAYLPGLNRAVQYLEEALEASGLTVERQSFLVDEVLCHNLWADAVGQGPSREVVVVGAHYDTCFDSPGANDNGSGVAAVLALAGRMAQRSAPRTLRFVLFVNEEPPYFKTDYMGSVRFARLCRERGDQVVAMLSLETMGYYSDQPGSQRYPPLLDRLYPGKGDFIGFVGLHRDRELVRSVIELWRASVPFPSEGAALPGFVPGIGWSDHWSFSREGYPALMITDTAPFRYPHYHQITDVPTHLDYDRMARVVAGVEQVLQDLLQHGAR